jgi:transcriptional regulator with XRE-family HTH domain
MTQVSKHLRGNGSSGVELPRAKRELALARARGEMGALGRLLAAYPQYRADLIEFDAAVVATSFADDSVVAETAPLAEHALSRALAAVFPAVTVAAPVAMSSAAPVVSLKALRQARHISLKEMAQRLNLGADVVSLLEAGAIAASTIPERLVRALGEVLDTAAEQIATTLRNQPAFAPALQRSRSGERKAGPARAPLAFDEAVRASSGMSPDQKERWLAGE